MASSAAETVGERLAGERPGRMRSLLTATVVGVAAAAVTYKLLRSGGDEAA
jgi:2-methylcitrate dehydratase PrpD